MQKISTLLVEYFRVIFLLAVIGGLTIPTIFAWMYGILGPLIILLMYLGSLDIAYDQLSHIKYYWKSIFMYILIMILVFPLLLYYGLGYFSSEVGTGFFLLAIAPAGIAAVAFTRLMGGNTLLALLLAVITTVIFPFILPRITKILMHRQIGLDSTAMFYDLLLYCILPLVAGYLTQKYIPSIINSTKKHLDWVSILIISMMIAGPVAYNAELFLAISPMKGLVYIIGLFILSTVLHVIGRFCFMGKDKEYKIAGSLSKGFMNISIVTVIAAKYFPPEVLLIVMLYEFPRDLMLIPFKRVISRLQ